ncbi:MAG: hypothetical protein HDT30_08120 [Clostridiales bacterium]|nr:hypothetical protein [Clostridiales bacterium]
MQYTQDDIKSKQIKTNFFSKLSKTVTNKYAAYWYPLQEINSGIDVISFDANFLEDRERLEEIKTIFAKHNISKVCVIPELDNVYYSDTFLEDILAEDEDGFVFPYFSEEYTFDLSQEWLIYKSHEFTVTFAGEWLVRECKEHIKDYEKGIVRNMAQRKIRKTGGTTI